MCKISRDVEKIHLWLECKPANVQLVCQPRSVKEMWQIASQQHFL